MNTNGNLSSRPQADKPRRTTLPRVDVYENADEVLLVADLPGVASEGLRVELDKGELSVHGQRQGDHGAVDYERVFRVSTGIDGSKIEAELANGVLRVRLPKVDALRPRRIQVKAS
jgi:HSP20 family protein